MQYVSEAQGMTIILWLIALTGIAILAFLFGVFIGIFVSTLGYRSILEKNGLKMVDKKIIKIGE